MALRDAAHAGCLSYDASNTSTPIKLTFTAVRLEKIASPSSSLKLGRVKSLVAFARRRLFTEGHHNCRWTAFHLWLFFSRPSSRDNPVGHPCFPSMMLGTDRTSVTAAAQSFQKPGVITIHVGYCGFWIGKSSRTPCANAMQPSCNSIGSSD